METVKANLNTLLYVNKAVHKLLRSYAHTISV